MINGYDAWKLSNPWDDGHYKESEEEPVISEPFCYKFAHKSDKYWQYEMITPSGYQIGVNRYYRNQMPSITIDPITPSPEEVDSEYNRAKQNCANIERISYEEFMAEFKKANEEQLKIATNVEAD